VKISESFKDPRGIMKGETKAGASGVEASWSGVERHKATSDPEISAEAFLTAPADGQHRGIEFPAVSATGSPRPASFTRSAFRYRRNGTCPPVPQNTMPIVKLHSPADSPGRGSSFHP
jgi:hypothetical protein